MNTIKCDEENDLDTSILLNLRDFSNVKHSLNVSRIAIEDSLKYCSNRINSMKNELVSNLEKGLNCYSSKVENLPSRIKGIKNSRYKLQSAIQIVDHIISLKKITEEFRLSMSKKDYPLSAKKIGEYLSIRSSCINLEKDTCFELDKGREELHFIICKLLEDSLSSGDSENTIYYVKLFVPLGKPKEGLERYVKFVRGNISDVCMSMYNEALLNSNKSGEKINFGDIFTALFVSVVNSVKEHQNQILEFFVNMDEINFENLDGIHTTNKNTVILTFYSGLIKEVNIQGSIIMDKFEKEYSTYLDNKWNKIEYIDITKMNISHRELDGFLEEASLVCKLFYQFKIYINDLANSLSTVNIRIHGSNEPENINNGCYNSESVLSKRIEELSLKYVSCEYGYLLYSINHALNSTDEISWDDEDNLISTLVEDVFFLLHKTLNRCISLGNTQSLKLIMTHINHILTSVVKQKIVQNLQTSKPFYEISLGNNNEGISKYSNNHLQEIVRQRNDINDSSIINSMYSWTHSINNLQVCIENLEILSKTITKDFEDNYVEVTHFDIFSTNIDLSDVDISQNPDKFSESKSNTSNYINKTIEQIMNEFKILHEYYLKISLQILSKISISPILVQIHEEITFELSEEESREYAVNHSFIPSLTSSLEIINEHLKRYYNSQSSEFILSLMIERIVQKIEHIVINYPDKKKFTIYGALVFENDIRNLLSYANSLLSISIRHKFLRLLEICDILNITSLEELSDLLLTDFPSRNWHLTRSDIMKVLFLKSDIDQKKLELIIRQSNHFFN